MSFQRVIYDVAVDAMTIRVGYGDSVATATYGDDAGVLVDYDRDGRVLSVEVIGVKSRMEPAA